MRSAFSMVLVVAMTVHAVVPDCCQFYAPGSPIVFDPCHQETTDCSRDKGVVATFFTACNASKKLVCCRQSFIGTQYYMTSDSCCRAMDHTGDASYTIVTDLECKLRPPVPHSDRPWEQKKQSGFDRVELVVQ